LHLSLNISSPGQKIKNSLNIVGRDGGDRRKKFYFSMIPIRISKHPPFASLKGVKTFYLVELFDKLFLLKSEVFFT